MWFYIACLALTVGVAISSFKHAPSIAIVLPLMYLVVSVVGFLGIAVFKFGEDLPFLLHEGVSEFIYIDVNKIYFVAVLGFVIGVLVASRIMPRKSIGDDKWYFLDSIRSRVVYFGRASTLFLVLLAWACLIFSYGFYDLLSREEYIPENIGRLKTVGTILAPIALVLAGVRLRGGYYYVIALVTMLIFFGYGSRFMAVLPICFLAVRILSGGNNAITKRFVVFQMFLSICFVVLAINARRCDQHGLIPYLEMVWAGDVDSSLFLFSFNYITTYSYSLTARILADAGTVSSYLYLSVTPLPGSVINWGLYAPSLRVNEFVPYNALSELALAGWFVVFTYYFIAAIVLVFIEEMFIRRRSVMVVFLYLLFCLFVFYTLQYNLRNATRLIYYMITLSFLGALLAKGRQFMPKKVAV